jgi:hypothetical protein
MTGSHNLPEKRATEAKHGRGLRKAILGLLIGALVFDALWIFTVYRSRSKTLAISRKDPCTFITKQELEEVMGSSFERMRANPPACEYYTPGGSNWVRIEYYGGTGLAYMEVLSKASKIFTMSITRVPGVGDEAYFDTAENSFSIRKKDDALTIDLRFYPNLALEKGKALASKALQHM